MKVLYFFMHGLGITIQGGRSFLALQNGPSFVLYFMDEIVSY